MINHHTILREDLKRINSNINKKYTTLRKQVTKTMEVFENQQIPVFPYQVCFGLFRQISETASLTASLAFFPFFQNIINLGFANAQMSREILTILQITKSIPKFQNIQNQTKLQSILALLVSKNSIDLKNMNFTHSLFNIVLSLENSRYRSLWMKSCTILYQTTLLLTNQIRDSPTQQKIQIFQKFLQDLVGIVKNQKVQWLIEFGDPFIILQIFSQVFDEKYFQQQSVPHHGTLKNLIPPILKQYRKTIQLSLITQPKNQPFANKAWQLTAQNRLLILTRVGCKVNLVSKSGFQLIEEIIKLISERKAATLKVIGYEGINYLFRHTTWMLDLLNSNFTDLFNFFLTTQFNTVKSILSEHKDKIDLTIYVSGQQTHFNKIMGSNGIQLGLHEFTVSHELKIIVKNFEEITYGLYAIYGQRYKIDLNEKIEGKPPLQKTYKFCLKTVFQTIKALFHKEMSEDTLQSLLKISQKFINMSGSFNDPSGSAIYIKLMCKYCLPGEFRPIGHRHIQINKMILNTANCLGHLFPSSCWVIVWKALQNYSIYYNRYLLGKQQLQSTARESDVQILYNSMDSIFTETPKYDDKYLIEVVRSLIEVAYECLENNYNDESRKIFAFERIQQIYKLNLSRINIIWPELSSSLLCITTSKVLYFRISALSLLNTLIPLSLNYLKNHSEALKEPFTQQNYQEVILEPWVNLVSCQFQQIKDQLIVAVNKLIIDYGHIMTNGWKCILEIVKKTNDLKSLQAIVETFLEKVHDNIMEILTVVDNVERKLVDTNQKFLCLTMIWAIGDYAHKNKEAEVLKKIYEILLVPEEMFNLGTEARQSSFYIFAEILVHNCAEKDEQFWLWIFSEIKKFYEYGIKQCLKAKDKQFAEEALKNLMTNLIKIYKKFFLVGKDWENQQIVDQILGQFYLFCGEILHFRSPQIYQSLMKQIKEIYYPKTEESLKIPQFYSFLQSLTQIYFVENDNKILKCLITYLPSDIFEILGRSLRGLDKNFLTIYKLTQKIFLLRLQAMEKEIKLQQLRIFFEEKYYYELMKKIHNGVLQQKNQLAAIYLQSLIKTLHKLRLYEDYPTIAKSLPYLTSTHIKFPEIHSEMTLGLLENLIGTRAEQTWVNTFGKGKDIPIWYISSQDLLKISDQYIKKGISSLTKVYQILKSIIKNPQIQPIVGQKFTEQYQCHHYQNEISICNFLVHNFYYNQNIDILKEIQREDIVDIAQIVSKRSQQISSSDPTKKGINAYNLLFKVSGRLEIQLNQTILSNQSIFVQQLFERIFDTLDRVKNTGNQNNLIEELRFCLKKMSTLELEPGILNRMEDKLAKKFLHEIKISAKVLQIPKAHIFYFQPLLSKCIRCKDDEALQTLEQIFSSSSKLLLEM